jgi:rubrerythrin
VIPKQSKKEIARYLHCSSLLEKKVATAYRHLAERTENNAIKPLLSFIAGDSLKHSTILGILSQNIAKPRSTSRGCERILGKAWTTAITHAQEETLKKKRIKDKEMASLIDNMIRLEDFVGEEYLTTINLGTLQLIVEHAKMDQESLEKVVQWIIEDEERHATIMKRIRVLITR